MSVEILVLDTRAGNLFSLRAAIERLGYTTRLEQQPSGKACSGLVIPGQGRFGTVMKNITEAGWPEYLNQLRTSATPMLGICVGMQIFFEASEEDPGVSGLGWFAGKAEKLNFPKKPMVGWADLQTEGVARLWPKASVYFVNSYAIRNAEESIATTTYGETFCAAVQRNQFTGVQFHPEKSGSTGSEIIRQALSTVSGVNHG